MKMHHAGVAFMMPKTMDYKRTVIRYTGLVAALEALSISSFFTQGHASYDAGQQAFNDVFDLEGSPDRPFAALGTASVIRDLTMPKHDNRPLYGTNTRATLGHHPVTNRFLADKANMMEAAPEIHPASVVVSVGNIVELAKSIPGKRVILKPVTGMKSQGVKLLNRSQLAKTRLGPGKYLLEEFIDTTRGIPALGIVGVHNIRSISIDSQLVGSIARVGGTRKNTLRDDVYGSFIDADALPSSMHAIIGAVHKVLAGLPGAGRNVIAIDMMRGRNAAGQEVDVLCEVNRRPLRICPYVLRAGHKNLDPGAIRRMASLWDNAEAALLAGQVR